MAFDIDIKTVSLEGFQVVQRKYFCHQAEPTMTIWNTAIAFNAASHDALNNCESIEVRIKEKEKCIAIRPIPSKEREAVQWIRGYKNSKYNRIECTQFARQLFESWKLDSQYHYRTVGRLVQYDKKLALLFDFSQNEMRSGSKLIRVNG
ncbi:MAG: hypothetical protein NC122_03945 [Faecalibacterium sp.]|nr:hypothetical protein [Ruminococcus sp.]MCM1393062.1 hypothetical protein [Ruminococcus sp.]MCM1485338.1 hypothetical protein [Faecalibacterium sp.]